MKPLLIAVTLLVAFAIGLAWLNHSLASSSSRTFIGLDFGKDPPPPTKVVRLRHALRALFA